MNPSKSGVLVPPRPNLGPEPWAETRSRGADLLVFMLALALVIALAGAGWRLRRLRARGRHVPRMSGTTATTVSDPPSPRERLIALSRVVREVLIERFGPAWRSKTTEEIAREAGLADTFGPEDAARLLRFLRETDRAKFADEGEPIPVSTASPDQWADWVEEFLAAGSHAKGARPEAGRERTSLPGP